MSKFQFDLDNFQALYHEPLAQEIVQPHPVLLQPSFLRDGGIEQSKVWLNKATPFRINIQYFAISARELFYHRTITSYLLQVNKTLI